MPKILVIRFSSIGDIVLTTPVIRCLKKQVKDASIHFLTKKTFSGILAGNPYLDKVYGIEQNISEVLKELKEHKYDYIIDLHNNLRTWHLRSKLKSNWSVFDKLNIEKWLMVNFKINRLPMIHIVDRYIKTATHLGVKNDGQGLDFFIDEKDLVKNDQLPESHRKGFIAVVIGAKHYTKQIPFNKLVDVCKRAELPVVLLGGKDEVGLSERVCNEVGEKIFDACGKFSLSGSASLIQQSVRVISPDTGLMHIASALKKDITSVWGNTIPGFGMYPYKAGERSKISEVELHCRPCSKLGYGECPLGHFKCMQLQEPADII